MSASDLVIRRAFAAWVRNRLAKVGETEVWLSGQLGRPVHWLATFEQGLDEGDELGWDEAWRLIEVLGAIPEAVIRNLLAQTQPVASRHSSGVRDRRQRQFVVAFG